MSQDRILPYSEESEIAVLGACIGLDAAAALELADDAGLDPEWFYTEANRVVWAAVVALRSVGRPVDISLVSDELEKEATLDSAGGRMYLAKLVDGGCIVPHIRHHLENIRHAYQLRAMIVIARRIESDCMANTGDDPAQIGSRHEYEMATLFEKAAKKRDNRQILVDAVQSWRDVGDKGFSGTSTGFPGLDHLLGGLMPQGVYVFSGNAKMGKTTLVRNIIESNAAAGRHVALKSLEQSTDMILRAMLARASKQSMFSLNAGTGFANPDAAAEKIDYVAGLPVHIDDRPATCGDLWTWARRMVGKHGCEILALDYLQLIMPDDPKLSKAQQISKASQTCTHIAKELEVAFLVVSSLSNAGFLKESGDIVYNCWAHVTLERAPNWTNDNKLIDCLVVESRFGPTGKVDMKLCGDRQELEDLTPERTKGAEPWYSN